MWSYLDRMKFARSFLTSVTYDGKIYAIGGQDNKMNQLNTVEVYDINSNTWTLIEPMTTARSEASACALNGKIFVVGGHSYLFGTLSCGEYYQIDTGIWTRISCMESPRSNFALVLVNCKIYAVGGWSYKPCDGLIDIEEYNIEHNKWRKCGGKLLFPRHNFTCITIDENIYMFGGYNKLNGIITTVEVWNSNNKKSRLLQPLSSGTFGASGVVLPKSFGIFKYLYI